MVSLGETVPDFVMDVYQVCVILLVDCVITQLAVILAMNTPMHATYVSKIQYIETLVQLL